MNMPDFKFCVRFLISLFIFFAFSSNTAFCFPKKPKQNGVINLNMSEAQPRKKKADTLEKVNFRFDYYNNYPGLQELNLEQLAVKKEVTGDGILSPDMKKMVYSEVYFLPQNNQTRSRVFYTNVDSSDNSMKPEKNFSPSEIEKILDVKNHGSLSEIILETGFDLVREDSFKTLTVVDWSSRSDKILVKETIGEHLRGIWETNLWVYDFNAQKAQRLDNIRKIIILYWKYVNQIDLNDYRWDITPLGWDLNYPDRIIANAYGYYLGGKHFLGCWSIDFNDKTPRLLSLKDENRGVGKHGFILIKED